MTLGVGSALMVVAGYYDELVVTGDLTPRWVLLLPPPLKPIHRLPGNPHGASHVRPISSAVAVVDKNCKRFLIVIRHGMQPECRRVCAHER